MPVGAAWDMTQTAAVWDRVPSLGQVRFYDALRDLFVGAALTPSRLRIQSRNVRP
jgi:hypothetical protein